MKVRFTGSSGAAYFVKDLINFEPSLTVIESQMRTGIYLINKVRCHQCKITIGWHYQKSYMAEEQYKEGKFVIERAFLDVIPNNSATEFLLEQGLIHYKRRKSSGANSVLSQASSPSRTSPNPDWDSEKFGGGYIYHHHNTHLNSSNSNSTSNAVAVPTPNSSSLRSSALYRGSRSVFEFRGLNNGTLLSRLRGFDKDECDEDEEVFVDA
ncbi:uncharacterized protein KQ657_005145 [Scheffersomyces spartinae]|uniref:Yippee domain-containing protein n=1 Tax=Scheffersomyces spartinae TaxID=45513 RepID=A0A9P7V9L7_9ASCO|nr:uncharacterized protein KQ657_005145 [Scheffersomyces spartinae]KAG7193946.1 hypothetical protein KQ657_005145 [Scheffersomyces spartinae]